jgi:hypothetical protein
MNWILIEQRGFILLNVASAWVVGLPQPIAVQFVREMAERFPGLFLDAARVEDLDNRIFVHVALPRKWVDDEGRTHDLREIAGGLADELLQQAREKKCT